MGRISGISLDDCEEQCCRQRCHAVNYRADISLCTMKIFVNDIIVTETPSGVYNMSVTQEFQGNTIVCWNSDNTTHFARTSHHNWHRCLNLFEVTHYIFISLVMIVLLFVSHLFSEMCILRCMMSLNTPTLEYNQLNKRHKHVKIHSACKTLFIDYFRILFGVIVSCSYCSRKICSQPLWWFGNGTRRLTWVCPSVLCKGRV